MSTLPPPFRTGRWSDRLPRYGYLFGAILLHLILFLMVATLVIWKAPVPPSDDTPQSVNIPSPPYPPQPPAAGSKPNLSLEPQALVVPAVRPPSAITTYNTSAFTAYASKLASQSMASMPVPSAQGAQLGQKGTKGTNGNSPGDSVYGSHDPTNRGFVGSIYDLKQTPDRQPTNIAETPLEKTVEMDPNFIHTAPTQKGLAFLRSFVKAWRMRDLDDYFKAPNTLTTTQFCIPRGPSVDAPKAYGVDGLMRARRWIAIYEAKVIPPDTGRYRFIGFGDDFLVVRIDGQNVLDGSLFEAQEGLDPAANGKDDVGKSSQGDNYKCGSWVHMHARAPMDMQVLIGEGPGGASGFILMIQKEGDGSAKGDYPVFQLRDAPLPEPNPLAPPSRKKTVFEVAS